jgi:hypothetical protein
MARRPRCKLCGATRSKSRLYKRVCRDCTSRIESYDYSDSNGAWRSRYKYHGKPCGICEAEIGENYDDYDSMSWEYGVKYYGKVICMGRTNLPICATCATRFPEASEDDVAKPNHHLSFLRCQISVQECLVRTLAPRRHPSTINSPISDLHAYLFTSLHRRSQRRGHRLGSESTFG